MSQSRIGIDELDFWLSTGYMMCDGFLHNAVIDQSVRKKTAIEIHYKFHRLFSEETILERINAMFSDPENFRKRVEYLRDIKIPWPWEIVSTKQDVNREVNRPGVAIAQELLIEITNLVHFSEGWKLPALLKLARLHFLIKYNNDYFVHYLMAEIVNTKFYMVGT